MGSEGNSLEGVNGIEWEVNETEGGVKGIGGEGNWRCEGNWGE